jgi:hypothetical protein
MIRRALPLFAWLSLLLPQAHSQVKWSELPAASAVSDSDYTAIVQGGVNKRATFTLVRAITASQITDATTVGRAILSVTNPSAIRFLRVNADNSVTLLSASDFLTAIGGGAGVSDGDKGDITVSSSGSVWDIDAGTVAATEIATDGVSADELNATGVESELEAVLDLQDQQGAVTDAQVPNTITIDAATSATNVADADKGDISISSGVWSVDANAVALATDTAGNYITSVATTTPITGGAAGSEGAALTLALDQAADFDFTGSLTLDSDALQIDDTDATHQLVITPGSNLTADRVLTITTGDAARTLTLGGDTTLSGGTHSGTNTGDQTISLTGDVTGSGTGSFAATIADNSVDGTDIAVGSDAQGDILYYDGTNWARLAAGTSGYVLHTNGAGVNPSWDSDDGAGGGAPADADYLVGTANGSLSAEIVVGTTPGGELGNTWASPTIDADAVLLNEIGDAGADSSITTGAHEVDLASTIDASGESVLTITNSDADAANDNSLIDLRHNDGADANVFYMRMVGDNDGTPTNDYLFSQAGFTSTLPINPPSEAYDDSGWNSDTGAPQKDAIRDKISTLTAVDFLVGTATAELSAEIAVGTSPGGELGGTWASPTVDDSLDVSSWSLTTPTIITSADFGSAGVRVSDDGDGAITFLGLGDGSDENLTINLDDTTNTATVSSSTGLNSIVFSSIDLTIPTANVTTVTATTITGAGGGITVDASGFNGNLTTGDNTLQEISQKLDDLSTGGATNWTDIADASGDTTIAFGAHETDFTSTIDASGEAVVTVTNTDADAANDNSFLDLRHNDGADANVFYARFIGDNDGTPTNDYLFSQTGATFTQPLSLGTSGVFTTGTIELGAASDTTLSRASAGVLAVEGTNVLLNGGALGTPSSGTLTNATGLPVSGITSSTSTALGVGSLELGAASDTTLSRSSAGVLAVEGTTVSLNSTSATHTASTLELGAATDTTLARSGAGAITVEGTAVLLSGGALGTPSSGTVTNLTGTASININGTVGATTPAAGTFTTLVAGSTTSLLLGTAGSAVGNIGFRNATSGTATLAPPTGALGTYTVTLPGAADTLVGKATTDVFTNKTLDGSATGNVLKFKALPQFTSPLRTDGTNVTIGSTAGTLGYGLATYSNSVDEASNWAEWRIVCPADWDTAVDPTITIIDLIGADTGARQYVASVASVAASASATTSPGTAIDINMAADGSGASGDAEISSSTTLTGWGAAMTPGRLMIIRIARDGDQATQDASTVNSTLLAFEISYGATQ